MGSFKFSPNESFEVAFVTYSKNLLFVTNVTKKKLIDFKEMTKNCINMGKLSTIECSYL
ncbi:hypothetical protein Scep_025354 [Stephania cephalantha]|uniref:Uncharacterized protein n=1 Tax=Stephania cephalantha TaxID=152367 RepID=A0AAP0HSE0_9MAGN